LSSAYQGILAGADYADNTPLTMTLNNLTVGRNYAVQVWVNDSRSGGTATRTETISSRGGNGFSTLAYNVQQTGGGLGQYAIGFFTATATNQTFTMLGSASTQINALQVRDVTGLQFTAMPVFSPAGGSYVGAQTVTITCATPGATIYYTTDGTLPNNTSPSGFSGLTVNVPANTNLTIKAYAHTNGWIDSVVASAAYASVGTPTWANAAGGFWATAGNWSNNIVANGRGVTADISELTLTGQVLGSPNYLAPEQAAGRQSEVGRASDVYALGAMLFVWCTIALAFIDHQTGYLPDDITLPLLWAGLLFNVSGTFAPLQEAVIGAAAGYLTLWTINAGFKLLRGMDGMGYGDFKMTAAAGAFVGWKYLFLLILLSSCVGLVFGVMQMLAARRGWDAGFRFHFGPYIAIAGVAALLCGQAILAFVPALRPL